MPGVVNDYVGFEIDHSLTDYVLMTAPVTHGVYDWALTRTISHQQSDNDWNRLKDSMVHSDQLKTFLYFE